MTAAGQPGVQRLSLAAVPLGADAGERGAVAWLGRYLTPTRVDGHCQCKAEFALHREREYIAGPTRLALGLVGWEIWHSVRRPPPLLNMTPTTRLHEEYEFASARNPWQRMEDTAA